MKKKKSQKKQDSNITESTAISTESVFNSLSAHIAILDQDGVILETNKAWKDFAQINELQMPPDTVNINYIEICDSAFGESSEKAKQVAEGIKKVRKGELKEFVTEYPCHSPDEKRWFYMKVSLLSGTDKKYLVVSHENITKLKLAEKSLKKRELELETITKNLEESNTALKVLLKQREDDKLELEKKVLINIKELVLPFLNKLKNTDLNSQQKNYLDILKSSIKDIASPFTKNLSSSYLHFTPQEIKVANLVKSGKTSKEMAEILNCSITAINFHRKNLRNKLGLTGEKINLRTYLYSLK